MQKNTKKNMKKNTTNKSKNSADGSHTNKKARSMEIMGVTYGFVALFLALIVYVIYFTWVDSETVINNSFNPRQEILASRNTRGKIYSDKKEVLAQTVTDQNGKDIREYPYENLFSHVVGFSTNGKMGVELQGNFQLLSSNVFIGGKVKNDVTDQKNPGDNIYTTLNVNLQKKASEALGVYKGAIIVTEPGTGKILAMVSKPDFDPNEIATIWEDIVDDKKSTILLNRATQGLYPPGSTFKAITALEYIKENPDAFDRYTYECTGKFKQGEDTIRCYHGTKHGSVDFKKSFAKSCNASFANIGAQLDKAAFAKTLDQLLFNKELPLKFAYNKSVLQISEDTSDSELLQAVIGQGKTQITPIHMAMITSAIANKGILMEPYVIDRVENAKGSVIKQYSKNKFGSIMSEEEAADLTLLMEEVVQTGTATKLKGLTYTAAGKTGSAEYNGVKEDSHAWFTGFAPVDNPQVVVTIIVEGAGSGGDYAVPIAKRIFDCYFTERLAINE